jgi:hypothetical protein
MKKIFIFTASLLIGVTLMGQAPSSFKYQAVLRDARGNIKANTATSIIISILQGSATGTVVYSETQSATTDSYGLINLELGNGTATVGTMSAINWATGTYFVKVSVDGVEMGTGQLLSVPYALYATKAANGFSGSYNDLTNKPSLFDGTWSSLSGKPAFATVATSGSYADLSDKPTLSIGTVTSLTGTAPVSVATGTTTPVISMAQANGTTNGYLSSTDWTTFNNKSSFDGTWLGLTGKPTFATVATTGSYADLINKPTTDGSETKVTAGANITVTGTGTTTTPYIVGATAHKIGDLYGGGVIFYVDPSGQHGLIAASEDISASNGEGYDTYFPWFDVYWPDGPDYIYTSTTGDGLGAGVMNTTLIVAAQISYSHYYGNGVGNFSAKVCADYEVTDEDGITFGDWYLPSKYELNLLYLQRAAVGGFIDDYYWSSTEYDYSSAWYQDFTEGDGGYQDYYFKDYYYNRVRAIRAF